MSFVDHYEVLQISPNAEAETIHRGFRLLATRYHPDNPETGDGPRFMQLKQAYEGSKILSNGRHTTTAVMSTERSRYPSFS